MRRLIVVALLALVPACGGSEKPSAAEDKALAQKIVLKEADLPGYTEDAESDDEPEDETDRAFDACMQNDPVLTADSDTNTRTVEGSDFSRGDEVNVSSQATVAESEDQARNALRIVRQQSVRDCLGRSFRDEMGRELDPEVTLEDASVSNLSVAKVGDEATGMRIQATISGGGESLRFTSDITIIRRERAVGFLLTSQLGTPFPESERASLARKMADRMEA